MMMDEGQWTGVDGQKGAERTKLMSDRMLTDINRNENRCQTEQKQMSDEIAMDVRRNGDGCRTKQ
jgi:hypothetical protein